MAARGRPDRRDDCRLHGSLRRLSEHRLQQRLQQRLLQHGYYRNGAPAPVVYNSGYNNGYAYNSSPRRGPNGDYDRDGIPNKYDRDANGDGVPDRFQR